MVKTLSAVALSCAVTIGLFVVMEVALRLVFPGKIVLATSNATIQPDSELIYTLKPGMKAEYQRSQINGGQAIIWSTNAEGYRGTPLRAKHDLRVVVFGDSNIQGVFSTLENTFAAQLEGDLQAATGKDVEVVNAGVFGYGPDQSLIHMSRNISVLRPDVVIFHVFADNDYGDLIRNRLLRESHGRLVRHPAPFKFPGRTWIATMQERAASLFVVRAAMKVISLISPKRPAPETGHEPPTDPDRYADELLRRAEHELLAYTNGSSDSSQVDHYDLDVALNPEREPASTKIALMAAVIGAARDTATRAGAKFLVLIEPSAVDLTTNLILNYRYLTKFPEYRPERLTDILQGICIDRGIAFVNLFPTFQAANPDQLYFRGTDNHWNDTGQALAAREVARAVVPSVSSAPQ